MTPKALTSLQWPVTIKASSPGPEILSGEELLKRVGKLLGIEPYTVRVPILTPRLSSYWLKLITSADLSVAQELVEGLTSDLIAPDRGFWPLMGREPTPFDVAARRALDAEKSHLSPSTRALEWALRSVSRHA